MQFLDVFVHAFHVVIEHRWRLFTVLALPIALNVIIDFEMWGVDSENLTLFETFVLKPYLYIVMAVTTHRIVLLGDASVTPLTIWFWRRRELSFLLQIVIVLTLVVFFWVPSIIPFIGWVIAILLMGLIVSRLCLVFPSTAIDRPVSFVKSWQMTQEYSLLMALVIFAVPILVALPMLFVNLVININWLNNFVGSLTTVVEVAALSVAFQTIQQEINFERF